MEFDSGRLGCTDWHVGDGGNAILLVISGPSGVSVRHRW